MNSIDLRNSPDQLAECEIVWRHCSGAVQRVRVHIEADREGATVSIAPADDRNAPRHLTLSDYSGE